MVEADNPGASRPNRAVSASLKSPVDTPFRYSHGSSSSIVLVRRKYGGNIAELNLISFARSRTRGASTARGHNLPFGKWTSKQPFTCRSKAIIADSAISFYTRSSPSVSAFLSFLSVRLIHSWASYKHRGNVKNSGTPSSMYRMLRSH
jgi:hypothetical protein